MEHPNNCNACPERETCRAAYYGGTMCRYEREIHDTAMEGLRKNE